MIIKWRDTEYLCEYAVKKKNSVIGYDSNYSEVCKIVNIDKHEWDYITLENGEWSESVPTFQEALRADVDYLLMLQE